MRCQNGNLSWEVTFFLFFFFFLIQFNVPFKIISLIETSQSIGGRNGRTPGKPLDKPASRTWLVSHVASAGLEPEVTFCVCHLSKRLQQHMCIFQPLPCNIFTSCRTINQGPANVIDIPVFSFAIPVYRISKMTPQFTDISVYHYPLTLNPTVTPVVVCP